MLLIAFTYYHTILIVLNIYISQGKSKGDTRKEETH